MMMMMPTQFSIFLEEGAQPQTRTTALTDFLFEVNIGLFFWDKWYIQDCSCIYHPNFIQFIFGCHITKHKNTTLWCTNMYIYIIGVLFCDKWYSFVLMWISSIFVGKHHDFPMARMEGQLDSVEGRSKECSNVWKPLIFWIISMFEHM